MLTIWSKVVIDGTGHDAAACRIVSKKIPDTLQVHGELPMWADRGESALLDFSKKMYPRLVVSGMAANAVSGGHRRGGDLWRDDALWRAGGRGGDGDYWVRGG